MTGALHRDAREEEEAGVLATSDGGTRAKATTVGDELEVARKGNEGRGENLALSPLG